MGNVTIRETSYSARISRSQDSFAYYRTRVFYPQLVKQSILFAYTATIFICILPYTCFLFAVRQAIYPVLISQSQVSFVYYRTRVFYSQFVKQSILFSYHSHDFAVLFVVFVLPLPFFRSLFTFLFIFRTFICLICNLKQAIYSFVY